MSIKLELDADSIKQAISAHIAVQGFNLEGKHVDVALVNGRGGNGNRATVTISDDVAVTNKAPTTVEKAIAFVPEVETVELSTIAAEESDEAIESNTDQAMYLEQDMQVANDIIAAAETVADPFGSEEVGLFPGVNPSDVETSKSLF